MVRWLALLCFFSANCYGEDWKFEIVEQQSKQVSAVDNEYYVVKFSEPWCGPCREYVSSGKLKRLQQSVSVREIDTQSDTQWKNLKVLPKVKRWPTFWLIKYGDSTTVVKSWEYAVDPSVVLTEIQNQKKPKVVKSVVQSSIYGSVGTSHESRETLIDHLLNDGIHKGRRSLQQLNSMTDEQLDRLHSKDHGW